MHTLQIHLCKLYYTEDVIRLSQVSCANGPADGAKGENLFVMLQNTKYVSNVNKILRNSRKVSSNQW